VPGNRLFGQDNPVTIGQPGDNPVKNPVTGKLWDGVEWSGLVCPGLVRGANAATAYLLQPANPVTGKPGDRPYVSSFICLLQGKRSVPSPCCHCRVVTDIALNVVNVPRFLDSV
jgi:hypothetical protein